MTQFERSAKVVDEPTSSWCTLCVESFAPNERRIELTVHADLGRVYTSEVCFRCATKLTKASLVAAGVLAE